MNMKKNRLGGALILYKRPISKNNNIYNIPKQKFFKPEVKINNKEEEQSQNHYLETVHSEINKSKNNNLSNNINNFKKINLNSFHCNSSRIAANNKNKNIKINTNFNHNQDSSSLFFQSKDNENKIYPNYNNTCNISLNQHFYNIDYNNFTSSSSLIKNEELEEKIERLKTQRKDKNIVNIKNNYKNFNSNKVNKKKAIYLNSFENNIPIAKVKDINNSYDSIDNFSNSFFLNNIIPKNYKKKNKINIK